MVPVSWKTQVERVGRDRPEYDPLPVSACSEVEKGPPRDQTSVSLGPCLSQSCPPVLGPSPDESPRSKVGVHGIRHSGRVGPSLWSSGFGLCRSDVPVPTRDGRK